MATVTETRAVQGFDEVSLRGYGELVLEESTDPAAPESLTIEADQGIMDKVSSEVRGGKLILGIRMAWYEWPAWWMTWAFTADKRITYRLRARRIRGLHIAGSGRIRAGALSTDACRLRITGSGKIAVEGLKAESVEASISGSGDIACGGEAGRMRADISGSGSVEADLLKVATARVGISGSGGVSVAAVEELEVRISGSGSVRYRGGPHVSSRVTGSGRIIHVAG